MYLKVRRGSFEEEQGKTEEVRKDLIQFLSHDTSSTRAQFVKMLRERADMIELSRRQDRFFEVNSTEQQRPE